jgi:hypothetical protein
MQAARFQQLLAAKPAFKIWLGTASASRRTVMDELVAQCDEGSLAYSVIKADIDEKVGRGGSGAQIASTQRSEQFSPGARPCRPLGSTSHETSCWRWHTPRQMP